MHKLVLIALLSYSFTTYALTPVIDEAAIIKIGLMIDELEAQYKQMQDHFKEAQIHTGLLSGKNAFGDTYNSKSDKEAREWAPNSIEEFEEMVKYGFNPGDLDDRYAYYQAKFPAVDIETIDSKNPSSAHRNLYAYNEDWTKLNFVGFAQTFDAVNQSYQKINNLLEEVNTHETLKQSSDFTNRLLGELAYLLQNMIQVQNFEMHINTMLQQSEQNHLAAHTNFYTFRKK